MGYSVCPLCILYNMGGSMCMQGQIIMKSLTVIGEEGVGRCLVSLNPPSACASAAFCSLVMFFCASYCWCVFVSEGLKGTRCCLRARGICSGDKTSRGCCCGTPPRSTTAERIKQFFPLFVFQHSPKKKKKAQKFNRFFLIPFHCLPQVLWKSF